MNIYEYSKEDLMYISEVLKHCSRKTIWRTFDNCNNYKVPDLGHGGLVYLKPDLFAEMILHLE